ncbi:MAG TPA: CsbD family protein, partial [bacterium]|nr:CsbD family protein [bacterium]
MNKDQVNGKWRQLRGAVKKPWGTLTDDELDQMAGDYDQLVGKIQERYGTAREESDRQMNALDKAAASDVRLREPGWIIPAPGLWRGRRARCRVSRLTECRP